MLEFEYNEELTLQILRIASQLGRWFNLQKTEAILALNVRFHSLNLLFASQY